MATALVRSSSSRRYSHVHWVPLDSLTTPPARPLILKNPSRSSSVTRTPSMTMTSPYPQAMTRTNSLKRTNSMTATYPRTYSLKTTTSSSAASTRPILHQNYPSSPRSIPPTYSSELSHHSASTSQSSTPSHSTRHTLAIQSQEELPKKNTAGRKIKDKAYFAFVLLPLSCWYTRGGKRLRVLEDDENEGKIATRPIVPQRTGRHLQQRSQTDDGSEETGPLRPRFVGRC
jgi:hypothetical protein